MMARKSTSSSSINSNDDLPTPPSEEEDDPTPIQNERDVEDEDNNGRTRRRSSSNRVSYSEVDDEVVGDEEFNPFDFLPLPPVIPEPPAPGMVIHRGVWVEHSKVPTGPRAWYFFQ